MSVKKSVELYMRLSTIVWEQRKKIVWRIKGKERVHIQQKNANRIGPSYPLNLLQKMDTNVCCQKTQIRHSSFRS